MIFKKACIRKFSSVSFKGLGPRHEKVEDNWSSSLSETAIVTFLKEIGASVQTN